MKKIVFLLLFCQVTKSNAAEWSFMTRVKRTVRVGSALLEPTSSAMAAVSTLSLISHATKGNLSEGFRDPFVARTLVAGALFMGIHSVRKSHCMKSQNEQEERKIKNYEFLSYGFGCLAVSYYVHRHSPDGLFTSSGARMLCQPAFDFIKYIVK